MSGTYRSQTSMFRIKNPNYRTRFPEIRLFVVLAGLILAGGSLSVKDITGKMRGTAVWTTTHRYDRT